LKVGITFGFAAELLVTALFVTEGVAFSGKGSERFLEFRFGLGSFRESRQDCLQLGFLGFDFLFDGSKVLRDPFLCVV
jgi:hypothetical protein